MSAYRHSSLDLKGIAARNNRDIMFWIKSMTFGGQYATGPDDFRRRLLDLIGEGVWLLPMSNECEGFDPKTGCPGHEVPAEGAS